MLGLTEAPSLLARLVGAIRTVAGRLAVALVEAGARRQAAALCGLA